MFEPEALHKLRLRRQKAFPGNRRCGQGNCLGGGSGLLYNCHPEGKHEALASGLSSVDETLLAQGFHESRTVLMSPQCPGQRLTCRRQAGSIHSVELNKSYRSVSFLKVNIFHTPNSGTWSARVLSCFWVEEAMWKIQFGYRNVEMTGMFR